MLAHRQIPRLAFGILAGAVAIHLLAAAGVVALSQVASEVLYHVIMLGAVGLCCARVRLVSRERPAWLAFTLAMALWSAADLVYLARWGLNGTPPFPNVTDGLYLGFYACVYVGVGLLLTSRLRPFPRSAWLEGLVAGLTLAAFTAAFVFEPVLTSTAGDPVTVAFTLGYPVADLLLLCFVGVAFAMTGWRPDRTWCLIALSLILTAVADGAYAISASSDSYSAGHVTDTLWAASSVTLALAAWQPATARSRPDRVAPVLMPALLAAAALGLLTYGAFAEVLPAAGILAAFGLLAAGARAGLTFSENLQLLHASRGEALTDVLTGLGNRRLLMRALEDSLADPARSLTLAFFDLDGFKSYNDAFGHLAGDALLVRLARKLSAAVEGQGTPYRLGGDEFCVVLDTPAGSVDRAIVAAAGALAEQGEAFSVTASYGVAQLPREADTPDQAVRLADERMYAHKTSRRGAGKSQAYNVLVQVLVEREPELHEHLREVAMLARLTAIELGLRSDQLDEVVRAAELHDIGKIAVPDSILHKPGPLDDDEWQIMREHPLVGERILATVPALRTVGLLVRASHESWDGHGYPDGLSGTEIPLGSRIIAVCDAFDAMTSQRPYAQPRDAHHAIAELRRCAGTQFDPAVVEAFCVAHARPRARTAATADRVHWMTDSVPRVAERSREGT